MCNGFRSSVRRSTSGVAVRGSDHCSPPSADGTVQAFGRDKHGAGVDADLAGIR